MHNTRTIRLSELRKNFVEAFSDGPVAVLEHSRVVAYMVSPSAFEAMVERLHRLEQADSTRASSGDQPILISVEEL